MRELLRAYETEAWKWTTNVLGEELKKLSKLAQFGLDKMLQWKNLGKPLIQTEVKSQAENLSE